MRSALADARDAVPAAATAAALDELAGELAARLGRLTATASRWADEVDAALAAYEATDTSVTARLTAGAGVPV